MLAALAIRFAGGARVTRREQEPGASTSWRAGRRRRQGLPFSPARLGAQRHRRAGRQRAAKRVRTGWRPCRHGPQLAECSEAELPYPRRVPDVAL